MEKKQSISSIQLALLAAGSALMFPYTFLPIIRTIPSNQDVWITFILSFFIFTIISLPVLFFANKSRGVTVYDFNEIVMGKVGGKIVSSIFVMFSMFCHIACITITVIYVQIYLLPETPKWAILILMVIPISYVSYMGAGSIGRLATFIISFIILTVLIFFIMGIDQMKINQLLPIMQDSTIKDIFMGGFLIAARVSEIIIIFIFSFFLKKKASVNKTYLKALGIYAVANILMVLPVLLVLGSDLAIISNNPYLLYTRQVGGSDFIQRVQSFNILAWFSGTIIKLATYNYMASYLLAGIIRKKEQKFYVIPLSIIAFIICLIPFINNSSTIHLLSSDQVFPWVVLVVVFVIPLIMLAVYMLRRKNITIELDKKRAEANA